MKLSRRQSIRRPPETSSATESNWLWRADLATVDPNSAVCMAQWLTFNPTTGRGVTANSGWGVATADAGPGDPEYAIPQTKYTGTLDPLVRIPLGTKPAAAGDAHLTVRDIENNREHDFWQPVYNTTTGRIASCSAGASFPLGALAASELNKATGNAANFPLRRGIITPEEIASDLIDHPLVWGNPKIGGSGGGGQPPGWTSVDAGGAGTGWRFPAFHNAVTAGTDAGRNLPEGAWLRLNPSVNENSLAITNWEKTICRALKTYGMFLRDNSGQTAVYTEDCKNRGNNSTLWAAVGMTATYVAFSAAFPWSSLQLLVEPARQTFTAPYPAGQ